MRFWKAEADLSHVPKVKAGQPGTEVASGSLLYGRITHVLT